ncbi:MAG: glycosyltransferase family 4 protein, partial [Sciscionella sp.]
MARSVMLVEFSPSGGLFQFAFQLGTALAARGHRVQLVTGPRPELESRVPGLWVRPLLPTWHPAAGAGDNVVLRKARRVLRAVRYHLAWLRVAWLLRSERPDVVQWSAWRFPVDGWMVHQLARRAGAPVMVALVHTPRPLNEQRRGGGLFNTSRVLNRCLDLGYSAVDATLVLGERSAEDLLATHPGARGVEIVPHGDEGVFSDGEPTDVVATAPVALFFGTLSANKGLEELLDAFDDVHARMPSARLVIAGSPSGEVDVAE